MHYELLLHAPVPAHRHLQILQVLAGVTAQPPARRPRRRRCYVFAPKRVPAAAGGAGARGQPQNQGGGSQEIAISGKRQIRDAGQACVLQLIHEPEEEDDNNKDDDDEQKQDEDHIMIDDSQPDDNKHQDSTASKSGHKDTKQRGSWQLYYCETPEPGKKNVTGRLAQITDLVEGDAVKFVEGMGYSCTTQFITEGQTFVHNNIVLQLYRILPLSFSNPSLAAVDTLADPDLSSLAPLDANDGYLLEAKITLVDGGQPDLVQQGTQELVQFRDSMKGCLDLRSADRLALDTRVVAR